MEIKTILKSSAISLGLTSAASIGIFLMGVAPQTIAIISVINFWGFIMLGLLYEVADE